MYSGNQFGSQYFGGDGKYDKDEDKEEDQPVVETPVVEEEDQPVVESDLKPGEVIYNYPENYQEPKWQTTDPTAPFYSGGDAPSSAMGSAALLGVSYYTVKNPLHVLELIGAVTTDSKNFTDIQSELLGQQRQLNPIKKAKNIVKGGSVVADTVRQIINPRQVQVATAGGPPLPGSIFSQGVDNAADMNVFKSVSETTPSSNPILERLYPGNTKPRRLIKEKLISDNPAAIEYRQLLEKYEKINKDIPLTTIDNKRVKLTTVPEELFEKDVKRLIELKEELDLPNKLQFNQELGAFWKGGELYRWGSKGEFKPEGYKGVKKRLEGQGLIPSSEAFDPLRPKWGPFTNSIRQKVATKLGLQKPEKDHIVRLENQLAILAKQFSKKGGFVNRPPEFMDKLAGILHRRGFNLGDQNLNFLEMSEEAHRTGKYSRHVISQNLTDAELPHTYVEAEEIFTTLKDGTKKWLNVEVIDINKGTFRLKDGDTVIPNKNIKSKGDYKFNNKIYEKTQRQGVSLTTRKILGQITDPEELADAYELFATDAGAHEIMSGIQTAASFIYDNPNQLDELSKQIRNENIPNMIKFLNYALTTPQFKGDPVYTKLLNRFTDKLKQNMADYGEALRLDTDRPSIFRETKQGARI